MQLERPGATISYEVSGQRGPWLTLVHGSGDNLACWFPQIPAFSERYRVLTFDQRGHGGTVVGDGDFSLDAQVGDVVALWKELGIDRSAVLGYSAGGRIALELAARHPQAATALIMANAGLPRAGGAPAMTEEQRQQMEERRRANLERLEREGMAGLFPDRLASVFSPGFAERRPDVAERYREAWLKTNPEEYANNQRAGMAIFRQPASVDLSGIRCPVLAIGGLYEAQWREPATSEAFKAALPQTEIYIFPTGHFAAMEAPEQFNATVLGFLARANA